MGMLCPTLGGVPHHPFERYRRGNKQTVEVRHVHIHSGGQGVVGIINPPDDRDAGVRE